MAICESVVKRKLEEISDVQQSLMTKEENLEDEINDIFANITALLEGRRKEVIAQLRSRVDGKCQRLGKMIFQIVSSNLFCFEDDIDIISVQKIKKKN